MLMHTLPRYHSRDGYLEGCVEAGSVDSKPAVQVDAEYDDGDLPTVDDVNFRAFDAGDPIAAALEDATARDENVPANANVGGDIAVNA